MGSKPSLVPIDVRRLGNAELNDPDVWREALGRKASMRLRNRDDPHHPFTEAVGVIQSVTEDDAGKTSVTVVSRRGEMRSAAIDDVLAAKIF